MTGKMLAKLLFLLMLSEVLLFSASEAKPWWRRRRRRPRPRPCYSSTPYASGVSWANTWHEYFTFQCPVGKSIKEWRSQHRNCKHDRVHYFKCRSDSIPYNHDNCAWSGSFVNSYDQPLQYRCPHNGFIIGVSSMYSSSHQDRGFDFRCCHVNGFKAHTCQWSSYENNWDTEVNYRVPKGYHLVGVYSYHDNTHADRRWKFEICKLQN